MSFTNGFRKHAVMFGMKHTHMIGPEEKKFISNEIQEAAKKIRPQIGKGSLMAASLMAGLGMAVGSYAAKTLGKATTSPFQNQDSQPTTLDRITPGRSKYAEFDKEAFLSQLAKGVGKFRTGISKAVRGAKLGLEKQKVSVSRNYQAGLGKKISTHPNAIENQAKRNLKARELAKQRVIPKNIPIKKKVAPKPIPPKPPRTAATYFKDKWKALPASVRAGAYLTAGATGAHLGSQAYNANQSPNYNY